MPVDDRELEPDPDEPQEDDPNEPEPDALRCRRVWFAV
jgi:hypothetical protein